MKTLELFLIVFMEVAVFFPFKYFRATLKSEVVWRKNGKGSYFVLESSNCLKFTTFC